VTDRAMARHATSDDAAEPAMRRLARYLRIRGADDMDRDTLANELDWKLDPYRYSAGMYRE
jgi:hypothetical protein